MDKIKGLFDLGSQSTLNVALKIALMLLMGIGLFLWWRYKKKRALKNSEKRKVDQMGKLPDENRAISDDSRQASSDIDDILGK